VFRILKEVSLKFFLSMTLGMAVLAGCKATTGIDSGLQNLAFSDNPATPSMFSEVFSLENDYVVLRTCLQHARETLHLRQSNLRSICRYNETRVPFSTIKDQFLKEASQFVTSDYVADYQKYVSERVQEFNTEIIKLDSSIASLRRERSGTSNHDLQKAIDDRIAILDAQKAPIQVKKEYYGVALSLASNIATDATMSAPALIEALQEKLSATEYFYSQKDEKKLLFPDYINFSVSKTAQLGRMQQRLNEAYANASEEDRRKMALSLIVGPAFRKAWLTTYQELRITNEAKAHTALQRMRSEQDRRIVSKGKTLVIATEFMDRLDEQRVRSSIAEGQSDLEPERATTHSIQAMTCQQIFGKNARTASMEDLALAAADIKKWKFFPAIAGQKIWAPLSVEGTSRGWGVEGWLSWARETTQKSYQTNQLTFTTDGNFKSHFATYLDRAILFCRL